MVLHHHWEGRTYASTFPEALAARYCSDFRESALHTARMTHSVSTTSTYLTRNGKVAVVSSHTNFNFILTVPGGGYFSKL